MKQLIQQVLSKNAYFILAAAWLFTIAFIITNYWSNNSSAKNLRTSIENYLQKREKDFDTLLDNDSLIIRLSEGRYTEKELEKAVDKPYSFFLYQVDSFGIISLKFWSSQIIVPGIELLNDLKENKLVDLINGRYEFISRELTGSNGKKLLAVALIPVYKGYFIENSKLKNEFVHFPEAEKRVAISKTPTRYPVYSSGGKLLFYLSAKDVTENVTIDNFSLILIIVGVVFLLIVIFNAGLALTEARDYLQGIAFFAGTILLLRLLSYAFPPVNLRQYGLFDPGIYSSGFVLNSLGDLLINSLLFCWIILFIKRVAANKTFAPFRDTSWHWAFLTGTLLLLVLVTFALSNIIQSLISDARISFNVTNFFSLDIYSLVGFIVLAGISFGYFFLSQILLRLLTPLTSDKKYITYVLVSVLGLLILTFFPDKNNLELNLYVLAWLLAYVWVLERRIFVDLYNRLYIPEILFWLFVFSFSISVVIIYQNKKTELEQRKRTAEKLAMQADPSGESILRIAFTYFDNDFLLSNFDRFKVEASNAYLKDSIINKNFIAYLNNYDTHIYTFDSAETPLFNEESVSYDTLNTIFRIEGKKTSLEGLRSFEKSFDQFAYIYRKEIKDTSGASIGYFIILSDPKKYKSGALVPELFRQKKEFFPEYSLAYSYAIYNNLELVDYYNDYEFPTLLNKNLVPTGEFTQRKRNGYDELWYKEGSRVVIYAKKDSYFIEGITLFAYLFSTFLLFIFIFRIITMLIRSRLRFSVLKQYWEWNIRTQIHGTIIFISLFSFIVIGAATIFFFNSRYKKSNQDELSNTIRIIGSEMVNKVALHGSFERVLAFNPGDEDNLARLVNEVADIHGREINLYDREGNLRISSNPFVYDKGILSKKMNPLAYYYMNKQRLIQFMNDEKIGDISYQSVYSPVRDENGQVYAYLNIPSFDSQAELKREISNFLVTLINLNAFIFLLAGVIALFIANRITASFILIGDKMRRINLGKMNEEIVWKRKDEIGGLVKEYNKMVAQLGESAAALAKSEREGAWREMARQVAHEIKNPLTPMKLSIQYLQKAIDNNSQNVKELSASVAGTLIEQIEHLSKIAADFSQFANIGNVKNEVFDLHDLLFSLTSLYETSDAQQFQWRPVHQRVWLLADKTQLNRLFTNLFLNALEACAGKAERRVTVTEEMEGNDAIIIKVTDNGDGIPEEMREKIFTPNFTTKSSGTGLGLAMCKTIVEQAKGNIWFETEVNEGTTFFVKLPVMRVE